MTFEAASSSSAASPQANPDAELMLRVGPAGEVPVDAAGAPVLAAPVPGAFTVGRAQRVSLVQAREVTGRAQRSFTPWVLKAVGELGQQERVRCHPVSGDLLRYREGVGYAPGQSPVFPSLQPAVIGRIVLSGTNAILLGRNAQRSGYFSLIAGYVGLGETFEEAMKREAMEETGRRLKEPRYLCSQPWPFSGSIMVAMHAETDDEAPIAPTDGELVETVWATPEDLTEARLPLPAPGSVAHTLITEWASGIPRGGPLSGAAPAGSEHPSAAHACSEGGCL